MKASLDPVIAAALEYEFATHEAILNLRKPRSTNKVRACLRWADALMQLEGLPDTDHRRAGDFLAIRGRIPFTARRVIIDAMMHLDAAAQAQAQAYRHSTPQTQH